MRTINYLLRSLELLTPLGDKHVADRQTVDLVRMCDFVKQGVAQAAGKDADREPQKRPLACGLTAALYAIQDAKVQVSRRLAGSCSLCQAV